MSNLLTILKIFDLNFKVLNFNLIIYLNNMILYYPSNFNLNFRIDII